MGPKHVIYLACCVVLCMISNVTSLKPELEAQGKRVSEFVAWFPNASISTLKTKIVIIPGYGYGVKATHDIEPGERIMRVPFSTMMFGSSPKSSDLVKLFGENRITTTHRAAIQLLYEKANQNSFWKKYIDILPSNFSTPIYFSKEEIAEFEGNYLRDFSVRRRDHIERQYEAVIEPLFENYPEILYPLEAFSLEEFKWALSTIWSRSFSMRGEDACLIPVADMFNILDEQTANYLDKIEARVVDDGIEYWTTRKIPSGEQIFAPQGKDRRYSNADLLLDYGFVIENNPNDAVYFKNPISTDEEYYKQKKQFLNELHLDTENIPVHLGEYDTLFAVYRIKNLLPTEYTFLLNIQDNIRVNLRNEKQVVKQLLAEVKKRLEDHKSSIEHDKYLLHTLDDSPKNKNLKAAITIRKGEKEILQDLKKKLEKMRMAHTNEKNASKREL